MLTNYLFINQDFEIFDRCGLHDDEVAEKHAERLAKLHNCEIEYCRIIGTIEPPVDNELRGA
jgi:hypothetical protein